MAMYFSALLLLCHTACLVYCCRTPTRERGRVYHILVQHNHTRSPKHARTDPRTHAHTHPRRIQYCCTKTIRRAITVQTRNVIKIGRPGYKVTKARDLTSNQRSLLFEVDYPEAEDGSQPRHRFMSAYEQKVEAPDKGYQVRTYDDTRKTEHLYTRRWERREERGIESETNPPSIVITCHPG